MFKDVSALSPISFRGKQKRGLGKALLEVEVRSQGMKNQEGWGERKERPVTRGKRGVERIKWREKWKKT